LQFINPIVELMIAERHGVVAQMIEDFDYRLAKEFIADHRAREHVPTIEQQIRTLAANDRCNFCQTADARTRQDLAVNVIGMQNDKRGRGLRPNQAGREN
jgi:hypothetical protein